MISAAPLHVRVKASQAQAAKIAAQVAASKTEPRGSAAVSLPTTPKIDQAALTQQAVKELMAETRRMPSSAGKLEDYGKTMAAEQPEMWGKTRWRNNWRTDCFERFGRTSSSTK